MKDLMSFGKIIFVIIFLVIITILLGVSVEEVKTQSSKNANNNSSVSSPAYDANMPAQVENKITSLISSSDITYKGNGEYKLNVDIEQKVDEIYEALDKTTQGKQTLNYLAGNEEEKKALLVKMIKAEIITQYPDLRKVENMDDPIPNGEIQGVIHFKRVFSTAMPKVKNIEKSSNTSLELDGIVAWGDTYTFGNPSDENDNYPAYLQNLLKKDVHNQGFEGETAEQILYRAGVNGYSFKTSQRFKIGSEAYSQVEFYASIRDDGVPVQGGFEKYDGSTEEKVLECSIGGVRGELTYVNNNKYLFTRADSGEEKTIEDDTDIVIQTSNSYSKCLPIIWIGNNNSSYAGKAYKLVDLYKDLINTIKDIDNYIVIIPRYYNGNQEYSDSEYLAIKTVMENAFGNRCIDLKEEGWSKDAGYDVIAKIVQNKIKELGYEIDSYTEQNSKAGEIQFDGTINAGDEIVLEYIPLGTEEAPVPGTLRWMVEQNDVNIKNAALQYFSLDASGNIVVATWTRKTTIIDSNEDEVPAIPSPGEINYEVELVKFNYKNSISSYTMPFDYLWTFLIMGEDSEFVGNLAGLALDSKIESTLFDELTVVYEVTNETHVEEYYTKVRTVNVLTGSSYEDTTNSGSRSVYYNKYFTIETNKVKYKLTYADVWYLTYKVDGVTPANSYSDPPVAPTKLATTIDTSWREVGSNAVISDVKRIYYTDMERCINQDISKTTTTSGFRYNEGTVSTIEKTDSKVTAQEIQTKQFKEPNFVKYYLYSNGAQTKISSAAQWLFDVLASNRSTASMVDLTKYMLYKATNDKSYGVTEMDFSGFNDEDFGDFGDLEGSGEGSISVSEGEGYWGTYVRGDKEYKLYHQNYYPPDGNKGVGEWATGDTGLCVATAYAIVNSGYGDTRIPPDFWSSSQDSAFCNYTAINPEEVANYLKRNIPVIVFADYSNKYYDSGNHALVLLDISEDGSQVYMVNTWHGGVSGKNAGWIDLNEMISYRNSTGAATFRVIIR